MIKPAVPSQCFSAPSFPFQSSCTVVRIPHFFRAQCTQHALYQGGRFLPFSGDFLKQLFTLSSVYDGIPFVIMRLPH